ncbi:MAG: tRNA pseudouridine(55) synthase TruB [Deltaproteobacteria bacterium]|nr:tRNA pseudouridine(55) synthase TruB [Deltaproteobacteria bacterium]
MNGIIVADKPAGWTSHDAVAKVKRTLGAKKVGHLGTLDPLATGVLPLVINNATPFARLLEGGTKVYEAVMTLGVETDTYDAAGKTVSSMDASMLKEADVRAALAGFVGAIMQVPPMYSAIKRGGVPLYKLARAGRSVEREAREVTISALEVTGFSPPAAGFKVWCSKGTYVRSICHDAGQVLGCGASLAGLRRVGSGVFSIDESVDPRLQAEALMARFIPLEEALRRAGAGAGQGQTERMSAAGR